jgi:acetolactate synthase-1/2/3 large subunit
VILAVGNSFAQHATFNFYPELFENRTLIHVNIDENEINKVYPADHALVSDAKPAVAALVEELSRSVGSVAPAVVEKDCHDWDPILHVGHDHIHPGKMALSLSRMLPDNSIVLSDAGAHTAWLGYYLELTRGQHYRKPGSFGPMAIGVNAALGVKCAHPDRHVIVGCGDGCYLMSGFELMTAVQYDIPVIWIIFNDREFKLIKIFQVGTFFESGLVEFNNPDYAAYARACGALGYRVESLADFEAALQEALASNKPALIDAHITRLTIPHYVPRPWLFDPPALPSLS